MSVRVRFDAEIVVDDMPPESIDYEALHQAVQDEIGHTGAVVLDVTEYEQTTAGPREVE